MNKTAIIITLIVAIAAIAIATLYVNSSMYRGPIVVENNSGNNSNGGGNTNTGGGGSSTTTVPTVSSVRIALLDLEKDNVGKARGCDNVVYVTRQITPTTSPLNAALRELFSLSTTTVGGHYNFIARTSNTLKFDRATLDNGIARVYLTGSLSGLAGVCDDPRAAIQIEETALEFATVSSVELYLNGSRTTLTPSQR